MIQSAMIQSYRNFSVILICAMLGACATTQRSSSGGGDQAAAPITDSTSQAAANPGDKPGNSSAGTAGDSSNSAKSTTSAGAPASGNANGGTKQGSSGNDMAGSDNEEAVQLKRQLAEQDAQINRLRNDQQAEAERDEADAARMRDQQAAAGASDRQAADANSGVGSADKSNAQDELAVFPANGNAAEPGSGAADSGGSAVQRVLEHSVYFGYDQASVPDKYDDMLMAHAAYLKAHPAITTEVQGNCDERGSREFNLALGARRAQAVKRALELAGANGDQISPVSYGAEKPVAAGKDEESYSQNRRVDIVY